MKMYHEVAVVKDGNKRVGWLLKKGIVSSNPPFLEYVDEAKFTQMVSQGLVQFFITESNQLKIEYTDEELKLLKKYKMTTTYSNLKDYLSHDINLQLRYLQTAMTRGTPYVYVLNSNCTGGVIALQAYIFTSDTQNTARLLQQMLMSVPNFNPLVRKLYLACIKCYSNYLVIGLPLSIFEDLANIYHFNITCKGLLLADEILMSSTSRKAANAYAKTAKGFTLDEIIKRVETV